MAVSTKTQAFFYKKIACWHLYPLPIQCKLAETERCFNFLGLFLKKIAALFLKRTAKL